MCVCVCTTVSGTCIVVSDYNYSLWSHFDKLDPPTHTHARTHTSHTHTHLTHTDVSDNSNSSCDSDQLQQQRGYHGNEVVRTESISISEMEGGCSTDAEQVSVWGVSVWACIYIF